MIVFPAIDLVAGKVVRLRQGKRDAMDVYSDDPVAQAASFREAGATWIHVVDLSSAFGEDDEAQAANARAIMGICRLGGVRVDVGGGVRSMADLARLADRGVSRIEIGTALVRDPDFVTEAIDAYGSLLSADVAARDGEVRVSGWREGASVPLDDLLGRLRDWGFQHLVLTDVARDGMRSGVDADAYRRVASVAGIPVVASGGVATLDDVRRLAGLGDEVLEGCIIGRALYDGAFTLAEALDVVRGC